mmetsp:Transcript_76536/g.221202  ORF Transcript_76536/g.221202 Transcript_76536/m.221202 type:complete len:427 (+) Transcript_76536:58-1338(+)
MPHIHETLLRRLGATFAAVVAGAPLACGHAAVAGLQGGHVEATLLRREEALAGGRDALYRGDESLADESQRGLQPLQPRAHRPEGAPGDDRDDDRARGVWPPISVEHFASLAPTREEWCPLCEDEALCSKPFLFVVAVGRSGSTTMMNMVNFLPGISIWGENLLMPKYLRNIELHMNTDWNQPSVPGRPGWPTASPHPHENITRFRLGVQKMMWDLWAPPPRRVRDSTVRGFKDIAWTPDLVSWIAEVVPCSRFIVNYRRDVTSQAHSGFWSRMQKAKNKSDGEMLDLVQDKTKAYRSFAAALGARAMEVALEDYSVETFNHLAQWLGSPCRYNHLIHLNPHGTLKVLEEPCEDCVRCPLPGSAEGAEAGRGADDSEDDGAGGAASDGDSGGGEQSSGDAGGGPENEDSDDGAGANTDPDADGAGA